MVADLARYLGRTLAEEVPPAWNWQGRPIKLIDGTTVSMPDTPENQQRFPQQTSQKPGLGFPIARLVAIMDLSSGAILNAAMGPVKGKGTGEHALLREMLDTFESGDIVIADRYYPSYALIADLKARGVDVVMRQHFARQTDFQIGKRLGGKDHIATWQKPKKQHEWMSQEAFDTLPVRELAAGNLIIVTTLCSSKQAPRQQIQALYKARWQIELSFRDIKTTLGMEVLRCKTPAMVEKEAWVYLLTYNLIRQVMVHSSEWTDCLPQQVSFKHSVQVFRQVTARSPLTEEERQSLMGQITTIRVGQRPDRLGPRAIQRRPRPHRLLKMHRHQAREEIHQQGHPKKLKQVPFGSEPRLSGMGVAGPPPGRQDPQEDAEERAACVPDHRADESTATSHPRSLDCRETGDRSGSAHRAAPGRAAGSGSAERPRWSHPVETRPDDRRRAARPEWCRYRRTLGHGWRIFRLLRPTLASERCGSMPARL